MVVQPWLAWATREHVRHPMSACVSSCMPIWSSEMLLIVIIQTVLEYSASDCPIRNFESSKVLKTAYRSAMPNASCFNILWDVYMTMKMAMMRNKWFASNWCHRLSIGRSIELRALFMCKIWFLLILFLLLLKEGALGLSTANVDTTSSIAVSCPQCTWFIWSWGAVHSFMNFHVMPVRVCQKP